MAWLIIDPAAAVYKFTDDPQRLRGLELQKWGWFNRYLLAYLDGGYIPTMPGMAMDGAMPMRPGRPHGAAEAVLTRGRSPWVLAA